MVSRLGSVGSEPSQDDVALLMIRFGAFPPVPE
jgi:hypothetical protein